MNLKTFLAYDSDIYRLWLSCFCRLMTAAHNAPPRAPSEVVQTLQQRRALSAAQGPLHHQLPVSPHTHQVLIIFKNQINPFQCWISLSMFLYCGLIYRMHSLPTCSSTFKNVKLILYLVSDFILKYRAYYYKVGGWSLKQWQITIHVPRVLLLIIYKHFNSTSQIHKRVLMLITIIKILTFIVGVFFIFPILFWKV